MDNGNGHNAKLKDILGKEQKKSAAARYFDLTYGNMPRSKAVLMEIAVLLFSNIPGALGIFLRSHIYRPFFGQCSGKVIIGKGVTFRHPSKIRFLGSAVLDDHSVIDAKGQDNHGITIGDGVYVGRGSIVYCKNGNITLGDKVSLSARCIAFSSNSLTIGEGTMIGSFTYILSGGEYDPRSDMPFCQQSGMVTRGPLTIGRNCWLGAHVTVLDAASSIGDHATLAAGSVVISSIPSDCIAAGVPAKVKRYLAEAVTPTNPK